MHCTYMCTLTVSADSSGSDCSQNCAHIFLTFYVKNYPSFESFINVNFIIKRLTCLFNCTVPMHGLRPMLAVVDPFSLGVMIFTAILATGVTIDSIHEDFIYGARNLYE